MTAPADPKETLHRYLRVNRAQLVAKLDGLGEYDIRRPLTPTGTNLLGLVKHVAAVQLGYFGEVFGRPSPYPMPWYDEGAGPNDDLWVPADVTRADVLELHEHSAQHSDATIDALDLTAQGSVPWWHTPDVSLHQILVHVVAETARHAGHADILRESIDGKAGNDDANLPDWTEEDWAAYRGKVEAAALAASGGPGRT